MGDSYRKWNKMIEELEDIKAIWEASPRDEGLVRRLSDDFVNENPELFEEHRSWGLDDTKAVEAIELARANEDEQSVWITQVWLFHHFMPKQIGSDGVAEVQLRNSEEEDQ